MQHASYSKTPFTWRSMLFVPASSERFLESALRRPTDCIQLDLEDSVAPDLKAEARAKIGELADRADAAGYDVIVRINRPWRMMIKDIEACVRKSVKALTLPKVPDGSFIWGVDEVLSECEVEAGLPVGHTKLIAMVEDANGLHNIDSIAQSHPRLCAPIIGAEDLAVSMRMAVDPDGLYIPNVMAVAACRRAGIAPIGFVGSVADFADKEKFRATVQRAAKLGFEGAFCIHPSQVEAANEAFSPPQASVDRAQALLATYEAECKAGRAACTFEGRMVDAPVAMQARLIIQRDEAVKAMLSRRQHKPA
jgi:citrate lyase subunit beta/citryl-CoA lyase